MNPFNRVGRLKVSMELVYSMLGLQDKSRLKPLYMSVNNEDNTLSLFLEADELSEVKEGYEIPEMEISYARNLSTPINKTIIVSHNLDAGKRLMKDYGFKPNDVVIVCDKNNLKNLYGMRRPNIIFANGWSLMEGFSEVLKELTKLDY